MEHRPERRQEKVVGGVQPGARALLTLMVSEGPSS